MVNFTPQRLNLGRKLLYALSRKLGGPHSQSGRFAERKFDTCNPNPPLFSLCLYTDSTIPARLLMLHLVEFLLEIAQQI